MSLIPQLGLWQNAIPVALKKLKDATQLNSFTEESFVLQSLSHPCIVQYLGLYEDLNSGDKYIVTEYLAEGSLENWIRAKRASLKILDLIVLARDAAAGLQYLEKRGIIHR